MANRVNSNNIVATNCSILIIMFSLVMVGYRSYQIQINSKNEQPMWPIALNIVENALTLHAHQLSVVGWQYRDQFIKRSWPIDIDLQSEKAIVNIKCPLDTKFIFKAMKCTAEVNLQDSIFKFEQSFYFSENSSKSDLMYKQGPIHFVPNNPKLKTNSFFDIQNNLPPLLTQLSKAENDLDLWVKALSKMHKSPPNQPFDKYLYLYAILKTIDNIQNLELNESITLIKKSTLLSKLVFAGVDYMQFGTAALNMELETVEFSNDSDELRIYLKQKLLDLVQAQITSIPSHILRNPIYQELIQICFNMLKSNESLQVQPRFRELTQALPTTSPHIIRLPEPNSFQKYPLNNGSHALSAYLWNNSLHYLDNQGKLWIMESIKPDWKEVGKVPVTPPNLNAKVIVTIDSEFGFDTLIFFDGSGLWFSEDGLDWDSGTIPEAVKNKKGIDIISAPNGGLILVDGSKVWHSPDFTEWNRKGNLPFDGRYGRMTFFNNLFFQYGGCNSVKLDSCHNYIASSTDLKTWNENSPAVFSSRKNPAIWSSDDSILIHGGIEKISSQNLYYSSNGTSFEVLPELNISNLSQHFLFKLNQKLIIIGGISSDNQGYPFIFIEHKKTIKSLSVCGIELFYTFKTFRT